MNTQALNSILVKNAIVRATCKEDLTSAFEMNWQDLVEEIDAMGILDDSFYTIKLLSLQSSRIFQPACHS